MDYLSWILQHWPAFLVCLGAIFILASSVGIIRFKNLSVETDRRHRLQYGVFVVGAIVLILGLILVPFGQGSLEVDWIHWDHYYLNESGDYRGVYKYAVTNGTGQHMARLIQDHGGWFGEDIEAQYDFSVESEDRNIDSLSFFAKAMNGPGFVAEGKYRPKTDFHWQGIVNPPLYPGESIVYGLEVLTKGTEKDALAPSSTWASMGVDVPTDSISMTLYAPQGYGFDVRSCSVVDAQGIVLKVKDLPQPSIENVGGRVSWAVPEPVPNTSYLIKFALAARH